MDVLDEAREIMTNIGCQKAFAVYGLKISDIEDTNKLTEDFSPEGAHEFRTKSIDFHRLLAKAAHNSPLLLFHSVLAQWVLRSLLKSFSSIEEERLRSNEDHEKIFEAIIKKDLNLSQELLENHIRRIVHDLESRAFD